MAFLRGTGLQPGIFNIKWHTTALNKSISQFIRCRYKFKSFLQLWFTVGSCISIILLPIASIIIIKSGIDKMFPSQSLSQDREAYSMEPIIIGVNLPLNQIWYYCITIIFCSIVHELGHALAAVCEDVQILGVGANVVFIMTMAYVQLKTEALNSLTTIKKLRILCAGIWHNLFSAFILYICFLMLPMFFSPLYTSDVPTITYVVPGSPLDGEKGFATRDQILLVNNCKINNVDDWYECLLRSTINKPSACVKTDLVHEYDESVLLKHSNTDDIECCDENKKQNACFEYIEPVNGILELPQHMCLPVRTVLEQSNYCDNNICKEDYHCIKPVMSNTTSIIHIKRYGKNDVIYIGHPSDVYKNVLISNFSPKYKFLSHNLPDFVQNLLRYLITCSLGLAIVNVVPCFWFDGQFIVQTLVNDFMIKVARRRSTRNTITLCVTAIGTFFIIVNLILTVTQHLF